MARSFHTLLMLALGSAALLAAAGAAAPPRESAPSRLDFRRDPRLEQRVRVRSEGMPVRRVLKALSAETGVTLDVTGRIGDERLVAFAPDAPLVEVLEAVSDLYRCTWSRTGEGSRAVYRLLKPAARVGEEQALREKALKQILERFMARLRQPASVPREKSPGMPDPWLAVYPEVLPIVAARSDELLRDGFLYFRLGALPQSGGLLARLTPALREREADLNRHIRTLRDEEIRLGAPPEFAVREKPPAVPENCVLTVDLRIARHIRVEVGLRRDTGDTWYNWFEIDGDDLHERGIALYGDRPVQLPKDAGGPPAEPAAPGDPLYRTVDVPVPEKPRKQDWIGALGRLSDVSGVSIYTDCYTNQLDMGIGEHPRGAIPAGGKGSAAQILDALCFPTTHAGVWKATANSFWWRRGNAAVVRSRRWLWESAQVVPAELLERLASSPGRPERGVAPGARALDPELLPSIAALDFLQLQGLGRLSQHMDYWHYGVRVPARLSPAARRLLVSEGMTWERLGPPDRLTLLRLVPALAGLEAPRYTARISARLMDAPAQGGSVLTLNFDAPGSPGGYPAHFALPTADPDRDPLAVRKR